MKMLSFLSRYRLLVNVFALALALGVLASSPVAAQQDEIEIVCSNPDETCISWDSENGCTRWMVCCVRSPDDWTCIEHN